MVAGYYPNELAAQYQSPVIEVCFGPLAVTRLLVLTNPTAPLARHIVSLGRFWQFRFTVWLSAGHLLSHNLIDEGNQFFRFLLIRSISVAKFLDQHSLFDPDSYQKKRNQGGHDEEAIQTWGIHGHADTRHDHSEVDRMPHVTIDAMRNEPVTFPCYQG